MPSVRESKRAIAWYYLSIPWKNRGKVPLEDCKQYKKAVEYAKNDKIGHDLWLLELLNRIFFRLE
jgi:hypothetical protein